MSCENSSGNHEKNHSHPPGFSHLVEQNFIPETFPVLNESGQALFARVPMLKWAYSRKLSDKIDKNISIEDPENYQVVMVSPPKRGYDYSVDLWCNLKENPLGKHEVVEYKENQYGNDVESRLTIANGNGASENTQVPETVYVVASLLDEKDYSRIIDIASSYRKNPGVKKIVLVSPFMGFLREDKNAKKNDRGELEYTGQIIKAASKIESLSGFFDKIITFEPHSSAAQTWAAENKMSLAPVSLWKTMINSLISYLRETNKSVNPDDYVFIRPDKGRNLAALRIQDYLKIKNKINFRKTRDGEGKISFEKLNEEEKLLINNKHLLLYDDEAATFGTMKGVVSNLISKDHKPSSITIMLGHARFAKGWKKNLDSIVKLASENNVSLKLFVSDSRQALDEEVYRYGKREKLIEYVKVYPLIREMIEKEADKINFWKDESMENLLIQPKTPEDEKEEIESSG